MIGEIVWEEILLRYGQENPYAIQVSKLEFQNPKTRILISSIQILSPETLSPEPLLPNSYR